MSAGVLVTGATTPLGRALCSSLLEAGFAPVLAVGAEDDLARAGLPRDDRLVYRHADLTRSRVLHDLLFGPARDMRIGAVVHSALHRRAHDTGRRIHRLNVESTQGLLLLAERHPTIERFVFVSTAEVYRVEADEPVLIGEDHPLYLSTHMPQRLRDRIEADVTVCMRMGMSGLHVVVLRLAELLAADSGSQLFDYLRSRVCFTALGYDPMMGVITVDDAVRALVLALSCKQQGIFNVPGKDVLPLSAAIRAAGRVGIPVPGPLLSPLYRMRARTRGTDFRYDLNRRRFHFSGVLDGRRASEVLGYAPDVAVDWGAVAAAARV